MTWLEMYGKEKQPTEAQIEAYIQNPLWDALHVYLQGAYQTAPKMSFSGCSGQPGWNMKYQKGGKSLCTLYPMEGFFIALVVVGEKERDAVEQLLPTYTPYVQALYGRAAALMGARWLMAEVTDETILDDVKRLIAVRRAPRAAGSATA